MATSTQGGPTGPRRRPGLILRPFREEGPAAECRLLRDHPSGHRRAGRAETGPYQAPGESLVETGTERVIVNCGGESIGRDADLSKGRPRRVSDLRLVPVVRPA